MSNVADPNNADSKEHSDSARLATFRISEDEVLLLALIRKAKRDAMRRTNRVVLEIDATGIYVIDQQIFMRAPIASLA
jgi:hypothetical protein